MSEIAVIIMEDDSDRKAAIMEHLNSLNLTDKLIVITTLDEAKDYLKENVQGEQIVAGFVGKTTKAAIIGDSNRIAPIEISLSRLMAEMCPKPIPIEMLKPFVIEAHEPMVEIIVHEPKQPWMQRKNFNKHARVNKNLRLNKNTYRRKH